MKHTVRSFSVGLLIAGLIMLVVFYIAEDTRTDQADLSVDEMIAGLEDEGYRVITESEYISYSLADEQQANEDEETAEEETATEEDDNDNNEEENTGDENESTTEEDEQEEENAAEENEDAEEEPEVDNTPNTVMITIESGTPSLDISYMLEEQNLIDDAIEFNDYVQVNGYALRIQLGEHELHDDMTYYDIAEELTN